MFQYSPASPAYSTGEGDAAGAYSPSYEPTPPDASAATSSTAKPTEEADADKSDED